MRVAGSLLLLLAGVGAGAVALGVVGAAERAGGMVEWLGSPSEALAAAETEQKPVLIDFWADWCVECHRMSRTTFADPAVVGELDRFVCAKVDLTDQGDPDVQRVQREYDVRAVPKVVLVDSSGERSVHYGYVGAERMLKILRGVR